MGISLVLQGPLCNQTFNLIDAALKCDRIERVIVSHWNEDDLVERINDYPSVKFVTADHLFDKKRFNQRNLANQALTSLAGLLESNTEYSIKLRSDWKAYNNFDAIIEKFYEHPAKILTSNIFFRPSNYAEYHSSDHLIVSSTSVLTSAFYRVLWMLDNEISIRCPEHGITLALLYAKDYTATKDIVSDMKNNFEIITIENATYPIEDEDTKRRHSTSAFNGLDDPIISDINDYK